jgi:hypothetical protein
MAPVSPSKIFSNKMFGNYRADVIPNLPEGMPFGRVKDKPIRRALESASLSWRVVMNRIERTV